MTARIVVLDLTRIEAEHLSGLVGQFADLLAGGEQTSDDPAIARLVPDAYPDDAVAAQEFRDVTESDLLERRRDDAGVVLRTLAPATVRQGGADPDDETLLETVVITLDDEELHAWLRCLAALRLVLAERLGIHSEDDAARDDDPRFGIYEWVGYRLEGLVQAASPDA